MWFDVETALAELEGGHDPAPGGCTAATSATPATNAPDPRPVSQKSQLSQAPEAGAAGRVASVASVATPPAQKPETRAGDAAPDTAFLRNTRVGAGVAADTDWEAKRIRARAQRRAGELQKQVEPGTGGQPYQKKSTRAGTRPSSRKAAAREAGMSERQAKNPEEFPHGASVNGSPLTWTGRVVSLREWHHLSEWERHGPNGRVWCGLAKRWVEKSED